jgi:hypothetical protein
MKRWRLDKTRAYLYATTTFSPRLQADFNVPGIWLPPVLRRIFIVSWFEAP